MPKTRRRRADREQFWRDGIDPWAYLQHVLAGLPAHPSDADLTGLLPDAGPLQI